eukprot:ctg_433.g257
MDSARDPRRGRNTADAHRTASGHTCRGNARHRHGTVGGRIIAVAGHEAAGECAGQVVPAGGGGGAAQVRPAVRRPAVGNGPGGAAGDRAVAAGGVRVAVEAVQAGAGSVDEEDALGGGHCREGGCVESVHPGAAGAARAQAATADRGRRVTSRGRKRCGLTVERCKNAGDGGITARPVDCNAGHEGVRTTRHHNAGAVLGCPACVGVLFVSP